MADDNDKDPNAGSDDKKPEDKKGPVSFTEEQQALLQKIVDGAYTKAYTKAEEVWKPQIATLTSQVEELKKAKPAGDPKDTKPDDKPADKKDPTTGTTSVDIQTLMARLDEVTTVANTLKADKEKAEREAADERKKNKEARIKEAFIRSADKVEFFDRMDVFALVRDDLDLDDNGDVVIMNAKTKQPRLSGLDAESNMNLDQYLGEIAKAKPHMVRAKNSEGGSGGGENRRTETTDKKPIDYSKLTPDEMRELTSKVISRQYTHRT